MRSISGALSANGLWYVLVGLFLMFSFKPVAEAFNLAPPDNTNFYAVLGAAGIIGLGIAAASLARNFTPAGVNGIILANFVVLLTMLYWLLVVKSTGAVNTTSSLVLWIAFALLLIITLAEIALLNNRRGRKR